jgi:hypothetical protein
MNLALTLQRAGRVDEAANPQTLPQGLNHHVRIGRASEALISS